MATAKRKRQTRADKIAKALNDEHYRHGGGFYVDLPNGECHRCMAARVNEAGKLEVREIRGDVEYWITVEDLDNTKVRDGFGSRQIPFPEITHYGLTRDEFASRAGKHPSCFEDRLRPLCGNGSYHAKATRKESEVDCEACLAKMGKEN